MHLLEAALKPAAAARASILSAMEGAVKAFESSESRACLWGQLGGSFWGFVGKLCVSCLWGHPGSGLLGGVGKNRGVEVRHAVPSNCSSQVCLICGAAGECLFQGDAHLRTMLLHSLPAVHTAVDLPQYGSVQIMKELVPRLIGPQVCAA